MHWPLHIAYGGASTVIQEFNVNLHTPLLGPDIPTALPVRALQRGPFTLCMMEQLLSNITQVEKEKIKQLHHWCPKYKDITLG